jgi:hypothetical protein
MGRLVMVGFQ